MVLLIDERRRKGPWGRDRRAHLARVGTGRSRLFGDLRIGMFTPNSHLPRADHRTDKQLFKSQQHPDDQMLAHAQELMTQLEAMGITASREDDGAEEWRDVEDSDDEDEEMKT